MKLLYFTLSCLLIFTNSALALPAFPGAMGMGADTTHGRGGDVYIVNTLADVVNANDNYTSLREAVQASGPRIVVFAVSGHIILKDVLVIQNPYLYIAGQTSPGGISIVGERTRISKTHDIVIRHLRFRVGYSQASPPNDDAVMENLQIWGDPNQNTSTDPKYHSYNIVIDHCSFAYGIDEGLETAYTVYDVTFSHNMIGKQFKNPSNVNGDASENNHDLGSLLWGKYTAGRTDAAYRPRVTMLGNVYISNTARQPEMNYDGFVDLQNNISYDGFGGNTPNFNPTSTSYSMRGNFINNYTLGGPQSNSTHGTLTGATEMADGSMYTSGNTGCNISGGTSNWCVGYNWQQYLLPIAKRANSKFATTGIPVVTSPITTKAMALEIVQSAGATVPIVDSVDSALISCFDKGTTCTQSGGLIYPNGWPTYQNIAAPSDTDKDGISDSWEISKHGSLDLNAINFDLNNSYTNIEVYINSLTGSEGYIYIEPPSINDIRTN